MSFFKFPCRKENPLTTAIINELKATPLATPDADTQPLQLIAHRGERTTKLGDLSTFLLSENVELPKIKKNIPVADISYRQSKETSTAIGLNILDQILQSFNFSINPLKTSMKGVSKVHLDFKNIKKNKVLSLGLLGKALINEKLDVRNPALGILLRDKKPYDAFLITSIYTCNDFSMTVERENESDFSVEIPVLEQITDLEISLASETSTEKVISFKSRRRLAIGFSCIEFRFDAEAGQILPFGEETILRGIDENIPDNLIAEELEVEEFSLMDQDLPALLTWDVLEKEKSE